MKKLFSASLLTAAAIYCSVLFAPLLTGCASFERTAYQTVGSVQITVDVAMQGWGAWVAAGKGTIAQEAAVKKAYQQYQLAAVTVIDAAKAAGANAGAPILNQAVAAASVSLENLVNLIKSFGVKL
jgi:hypothetical protein